MYISDSVKYLQLFNNDLLITIWTSIWGSRFWQLIYVKFWAFLSFTGLSLLIAFSFKFYFVLDYWCFFLLYQNLTHLRTWSLWKSSMVIPDVLIRNTAFRALLDRRFLTPDLIIFIWLNSLSSKELIHAHREISQL